MAYQSIGRGSTANDGTGDDLRAGAAKVNSNFSELYTLLGNGTNLTSDVVVLKDATQTVTNKTINSSNNTLTVNLSEASVTGTIAQFNSAMSDGNFVTDVGAVTLTNKVINTDSNTITFDLADSNTSLIGTTAQFNSALSDGSFATLAGNETLTNKTIAASGNTITISIDNMSDVDITTSAPTSNQVLAWDGTSKFVPATIARIANVVEDTTPQLGGNLDVNGNAITNTSGDITITPTVDVDFGSNKIKYSNVYSVEGELPSASTYHGMVAHVHGTGALYYAHGGAWHKVLTDISDGPVTNYSSPSPTLLYTTNTASSTNGYRFTGPGITATDNNPVFNLYRGFTYIFDNSSFNSTEPMQIRVSSDGAAVTEGISSPSTGIIKFIVPMVPSDTTLVYQSTVTVAMVGTINII